MPSEVVTPAEAWAEMSSGGAAYVDVRSRMEFDAGHPQDAWNVPLLDHDAYGRMVPNEAFVTTLTGHFAKDARLIVGCQAGHRSAHAMGLLRAAGFENVSDCAAGWGGARDEVGRLIAKGWPACGLPTSRHALAGRDWPSLDRGSSAKS